jgi:hypothetical protein
MLLEAVGKDGKEVASFFFSGENLDCAKDATLDQTSLTGYPASHHASCHAKQTFAPFQNHTYSK